MKHLPKHLRPRRRYIAVEIEAWPDATFRKRDFQRECWYATQNLLGDAASADADIRVIDFSFSGDRGTAIVRVRREEVERARAALACVDSVSDASVGLRVLGVSGTIRACEERYIGRAPIESAERNVAFADARRSAIERDGKIDVRMDHGFAGATPLDI